MALEWCPPPDIGFRGKRSLKGAHREPSWRIGSLFGSLRRSRSTVREPVRELHLRRFLHVLHRGAVNGGLTALPVRPLREVRSRAPTSPSSPEAAMPNSPTQSLQLQFPELVDITTLAKLRAGAIHQAHDPGAPRADRVGRAARALRPRPDPRVDRGATPAGSSVGVMP